MPPKTTNEIIEAFDKRFCSFNLSADERCEKCLHKTFDGSSVADGCGSADEYIKKFIIEALSHQSSELKRKIEGMHVVFDSMDTTKFKTRGEVRAYKMAKDDILKLI